MFLAANSRRIGVTLVTVLATAVLAWFGNGLNPWWPLLWFAPLPVLMFATCNSLWNTALTAALSWLAGGLAMWDYFRVLHAPASTWMITYSSVALVFTGAVLLFRALLLRGASWSALLAFPATWVSCEYVSNLMTPHGTAGSLAYSQLDFLPFLQLASITGPWGMSFLLMLFPAALAVSVHLRRSEPKRALSTLGAALGVIVLVLIFGVVRLTRPQSKQEVRVGLVASDEPANVDVAAEGTETSRLLRDYAEEAERLAARGAQVIVLPEKLGVIEDPDSGKADAIFQSLANKTRSTIVVGLIHVARPFEFNQARVYAPGTPVLSYDKRHMLPPVESKFKPGTTVTLLPKPPETWGVAICKDMDFTPLSRRYGRAGVGLMLVPAWDFDVDRGWHGHMAVMRGVEDGFSVVRAAKNGYLSVSDNRGRILAETRSDSAPFATLIAEIPAVHNHTLYQMMGDWFAWLALATMIFALIQLYRVRG